MEYVYPDYYRQFTCIGGECPDTCCAGWEIVIDDKPLKSIRNIPAVSVIVCTIQLILREKVLSSMTENVLS